MGDPNKIDGESESIYQFMFDAAPARMALCDLHTGCIVIANRAFGQMLGYNPGELEGRSVVDLSDPDYRQQAQSVLERIGKYGNTNSEFSHFFRHKDGSVVQVYGTIAALGSAADSRPYAVLKTEDNGANRTSEAAQVGEANYRALMQQSMDGVLIVDAVSRRIIDVNAVVCNLLGYSREELLALRGADITAPEDLATTGAMLSRALAGENVRRDTKARRKDGSILLIEASGNLLADGRVQIVMRDITARKSAEEALRRSEEGYRSLVETSSEWIWADDLQGNHLFSNPAVRRILGYEPGELVGQDVVQLIHPDDRERARLLQRDALQQERGWRGATLRWLHRDGSTRYLESNSTPIFDAQGKMIGLSGSDRDITERIRAEDDRRALVAAEAAALAKREFLARMSHELRTPLNAILGFAQVLQMSDLDEIDSDSVDNILLAGQHLLGLINKVLDITRIEEGQLPLVIERIELGELVGETVSLIQPDAESHKIKLAPNMIQSCGHEVLADEERLKQALGHLLSNAIEYNRPGGVVTVDCKLVPDPSAAAHSGGAKVRISVRDTGNGISAEQLPRLFTPFERLEAAQRGIDGTGLGLVLARLLVVAMGGDIGVQSVVGQGSTFWIDIPQAPPQNIVAPTH